jgi:putative membrane protein
MNPSSLRISRLAGAVIMATALCATVAAQVEPTPTPNPTPVQQTTPVVESAGSLSHHDKSFLKKAAKGGMKEVAVSQAVMGHLTNPDVRSFAQMMVTDHTAANNELAALTASKGAELPVPDADLASDWSKKTEKVDSTYVKEMLADHEDAVKLFEKGSLSKDPEIAAFAQKTLPTLEHHLKLVQDLDKAIN